MSRAEWQATEISTPIIPASKSNKRDWVTLSSHRMVALASAPCSHRDRSQWCGRVPRASRPWGESLSPWTAQLTELARRVAPVSFLMDIFHAIRHVSLQRRDVSVGPRSRCSRVHVSYCAMDASYSHVCICTCRDSPRSSCAVRAVAMRACACVLLSLVLSSRPRNRGPCSLPCSWWSSSLTRVVTLATPPRRREIRSISEPAVAGFRVAHTRRYCAILRIYRCIASRRLASCHAEAVLVGNFWAAAVPSSAKNYTRRSRVRLSNNPRLFSG